MQLIFAAVEPQVWGPAATITAAVSGVLGKAAFDFFSDRRHVERERRERWLDASYSAYTAFLSATYEAVLLPRERAGVGIVEPLPQTEADWRMIAEQPGGWPQPDYAAMEKALADADSKMRAAIGEMSLVAPASVIERAENARTVGITVRHRLRDYNEWRQEHQALESAELQADEEARRKRVEHFLGSFGECATCSSRRREAHLRHPGASSFATSGRVVAPRSSRTELLRRTRPAM